MYEKMMEKMNLYIQDTKPIYINGPSGSGKTQFLNSYFDNTNMNVIIISLKNIYNIEYIDEITNVSIMDVFNKIKRDIVIIIDDIDILNIHEKTIINDIIKKIKNINKCKLKISYKLIFSGINFSDKKIKELLSLCNVIYFGDYYCNKNIYLNIENIIQKKNKHTKIFEYDKAIQSLLLHENIINNITNQNLDFYYTFLNNFCNGDYYDRISFQKQIWLYNDITFYIKFIINLLLYDDESITISKSNIRFTKILTKYSNEYNNNVYINNICNKMFITNKELYNLCLNQNCCDIPQKELKRLYKIYGILE